MWLICICCRSSVWTICCLVTYDSNALFIIFLQRISSDHSFLCKVFKESFLTLPPVRWKTEQVVMIWTISYMFYFIYTFIKAHKCSLNTFYVCFDGQFYQLVNNKIRINIIDCDNIVLSHNTTLQMVCGNHWSCSLPMSPLLIWKSIG